MKLLILAPYPPAEAPSQRFRFEQYLPALADADVSFDYKTFWNQAQWRQIYRKGSVFSKIAGTLNGFFRRIVTLLQVDRYDVVYIHREVTPVGPPFAEWVIAKLWRKKIIFDFDDAIWLRNNSEANAKFVGAFKNHGKTAKIISWSHLIFAGNEYLANYARQFNKNVKIIPTTIDTELAHNQLKKHTQTKLPIIGWTGTHSTIKQLDSIWPVLQKIHQTRDFRFCIVADVPPVVTAPFIEFIPWEKQHEIETLLRFDIGIMPLYNTEWEKGKCGFKALQYMALGIPPVVSAVGVNSEIVSDGADGYLVAPEEGGLWEMRLLELMDRIELRAELGANARRKVEQRYSVKAYTDKFVGAIKNSC